jgi:hypothetical protein
MRKPRNAEPRLFQILGHASLKSNGSDRVGKSRIAISLCKSFTTPETPISRTPTLRDLSPRVPAVWTALILSGNRGSRFLHARVLCLWKLRCSKRRLVRISCHASSPMDGSKLPSGNRGSRFQHARVLCPRKPRFSDELNPDDFPGS